MPESGVSVVVFVKMADIESDVHFRPNTQNNAILTQNQLNEDNMSQTGIYLIRFCLFIYKINSI